MLWARRRHVFDRESGRCVESPLGIMREWRLHPFEVVKNERVGESYGKLGEAPVSRVAPNTPTPSDAAIAQYATTRSGTLTIGANGATLS